jgi:hypothetical protein
MKANRCAKWKRMVSSRNALEAAQARWPCRDVVFSDRDRSSSSTAGGEGLILISFLGEKGLLIGSHDFRRAIPSLVVEVDDVITLEMILCSLQKGNKMRLPLTLNLKRTVIQPHF